MKFLWNHSASQVPTIGSIRPCLPLYGNFQWAEQWLVLTFGNCVASQFWDQPMHFFHDISPGVEYHVLTCGSTFVNPPVGTPFAFARPTMSSFLSFARFSKVFCLGSSQPAACSRATRTPSLNLQQTGLNEGANKKVWWLVWGQIVQKSFYYVLSLSAIANKQPFHCTS